jgi:hypothetical protein
LRSDAFLFQLGQQLSGESVVEKYRHSSDLFFFWSGESEPSLAGSVITIEKIVKTIAIIIYITLYLVT